MTSGTSAIRAFYKNKNILLTGSTGFVGLGIVEKLLRSFPDVGRIFMIVRPRPTQTVTQRKESFIQNPVFNRLNKEKNVDYSKLHWIEGDMSKTNLGLSQEIITKLQDSINVIIHSAANVKFDEPLKNIIGTNVSGTNDLLNIASDCKNIESFLHVSTVYCKTRKGVEYIDELIHKHPIKPQELIQLGKTKSEAEISAMTNDLLQDWPNTYSYTKNAGENLCLERKGQFPIGIHRLGAVMSSYTDPAPYWIGRNTAFARILMEAGRGFVLETNPNVNANCVPVDFLVNATLMAAYRTAIDKSFKVYNNTTNNNPFDCLDMFALYANNLKNYEELVAKRKELLSMTNPKPGSKELNMILKLKHYQHFHETALCYMQDNYKFDTTSLDTMWANMTVEEKQLLQFDVRACDWLNYYSNMPGKLFGTSDINFNDVL